MYNVKAPPGGLLGTYLSNINLGLKLSGSCSRCCENGRPISVRVSIDDVNGLEKIENCQSHNSTNLTNQNTATSSRVSALRTTNTGPNISSV